MLFQKSIFRVRQANESDIIETLELWIRAPQCRVLIVDVGPAAEVVTPHPNVGVPQFQIVVDHFLQLLGALTQG